MSIEPADHEARKQRRLRLLRSNEPRCATCGEQRWQALELHHVAGRAHDGATIILCRNCHRLASDAQCNHPRSQASIDPHMEMIGRFLLGLADMLRIIVEKLAEFGQTLIARAAASAP